uniref:Peroxisomal trans-2-enoyl-CoA reductase n=1 Tax=Phallusia mammillata TaxID=59560 RepID=A0A6F9DNK8_9ASCI|nr:peroxisomal trans-2-enoyl-CoA reductase-like [Phallusia mammillata]
MNVCSVFKLNLFAGKVAIVTGGGTGIGATITQELAHLGCDVVIASRSEEKLRHAAEKFNSNPKLTGKVSYIPCNVRKEDQVKNLMHTVVKQFGKIDFLVNNSGGQFFCPAEEISKKGWNAVIDTNLTGTFLCCQHAFQSWMGENGGTIVNIIANMWRGFPVFCHTGAARSAVDNLTKTLALEWADKGIRINSVAPGTIYSETAAANYPRDIFSEAIKLQPTGRLGGPEEISGIVCFLLSPAAAFLTGETVKVDGAESLYKCLLQIPMHNQLPAWKWDKSKL